MDEFAGQCKSLGEGVRLKIIQSLLEGEKCVCDLIEELELSQAAISHHLKILKQAGFLKFRKEGRWSFYSLDKKGFEGFEESLKKKIIKPIEKVK